MVQSVLAAAARPWDNPVSMIGVDDARERILTAFAPLEPVELPLSDALAFVLAQDVRADTNIPPFPNAAMDGFAVRVADTVAAREDQPVRLRVIGEVAAGYLPSRQVVPGTAVRIMTGAPVPVGADAVVRFEETDEAIAGLALNPDGERSVGITRAAKPRENIRPAGEDVHAGETVLRQGTRLRPAEIGLLAALGRTRVRVHRRPRVAILATGDEVVDPGGELGPGQIRNSNSATVAAMVCRHGGEPILLGVARDTPAALRTKLAKARDADLLITTGGVSVGDYDCVKDVLCREGAIELWQVRIKPGKPLAFGWVGGVPVLGLPGNPVAAAVAFEQFGRPAIRKMLGQRDLAIPTICARLLDRVENRGGRRHFVRVHVETTAAGYVARLAGAQGAGILTSLVAANGLLVVPEDISVAQPGVSLPVQMLDWDLG